MSDLLTLLQTRVGKSQAIPASEIARALGIEDGGGSPTTRHMIAELVREGHPIAACERGFFFCATEAEASDYANSLTVRANEIDARRAAFHKAWWKYLGESAIATVEQAIRWAPADPEERE